MKENTIQNQSEEEELTEEEKFFVDFSSTNLDNKDPSLEGKFYKLYEEEIPFEIRIKDEKPPNDSIFTNLLCRIYYKLQNNILANVKVEINYDKDIFFYYISNLDIQTFKKLQENQKLLKNFRDFPEILGKYLELCDYDKEHYLAVFNINKDKTAKLEIIENLDYKFVELMSLNFALCTDDFEIRKQVIYRYNLIKQMYSNAIKRVKIVNRVLKENESELIPEIKNEISKIKIDANIRSKPLLEQQLK